MAKSLQSLMESIVRWATSPNTPRRRKLLIAGAVGILCLLFLILILPGRRPVGPADQAARKSHAAPERKARLFSDSSREEEASWFVLKEKEIKDGLAEIKAERDATQKLADDLKAQQEAIKKMLENLAKKPMPGRNPPRGKEQALGLDLIPDHLKDFPPEPPVLSGSGGRLPAPGSLVPALVPQELSSSVFPIQIVTKGESLRSAKEAAREKRSEKEKPEKGSVSALVSTIPAGSFARARLISGIDAPTNAQTFPVLLFATEGFTAPNGRSLPLEDCFFIAQAQGDLAQRRVLMGINRLSCTRDGQAIELKVNGYVVGEDGKFGLPGDLVVRSKEFLASSFLASFTSAFSRAVASKQSVTTLSPLTGAGTTVVTGDTVKYGAALGAGEAAEGLAKYYLNLAEKAVPVIEVDPGRDVTLVIQPGIQEDGLKEVSEHVSETHDSGLD